MSPRTTPKRSSSYRHSLMTFSWLGACTACPIGCSADLLRFEDVLEQPLPFPLLFPGEDSGNDFSVLQPLAHIGGIDRHVVAGWHAAARRQELLGLAAEDEVRAQQGGLGCGACELTPTEPKNSATGSSAQKSMAAPDNCTLMVSDE